MSRSEEVTGNQKNLTVERPSTGVSVCVCVFLVKLVLWLLMCDLLLAHLILLFRLLLRRVTAQPRCLCAGKARLTGKRRC